MWQHVSHSRKSRHIFITHIIPTKIENYSSPAALTSLQKSARGRILSRLRLWRLLSLLNRRNSSVGQSFGYCRIRLFLFPRSQSTFVKDSTNRCFAWMTIPQLSRFLTNQPKKFPQIWSFCCNTIRNCIRYPNSSIGSFFVTPRRIFKEFRSPRLTEEIWLWWRTRIGIWERGAAR